VDDPEPVDLALLAEIIGEQERAELLETAGLLVEELPDLLAPLHAAVAAQDRQALADAAHAAKSAASSAAAMPLAQVLDGIESDAAGAEWASLGMQAEAVRREFERLAAYLRACG